MVRIVAVTVYGRYLLIILELAKCTLHDLVSRCRKCCTDKPTPTPPSKLCKCERVSEKDCRKYAFQVLGTIEGLNEHGIVHRDIKPANLLLTWEGDAETADLNACAYNEGEGLMHTIEGGLMVGMEGFRAPEVEVLIMIVESPMSVTSLVWAERWLSLPWGTMPCCGPPKTSPWS